MQRSWAYLFYDLALIAVLMLPLSLATALIGERDDAALVCALILTAVTSVSLIVARFSRTSLSDYWRSFGRETR